MNNSNNLYNKIKKAFGLSFSLAKAEFKLKNEGSYLGPLWYLLNPVLLFLLFYLIFSDRLGNNIRLYPLYLFLGIIMFNFFQNSTSESCDLISKAHNRLIKSINFSRESLIAAVILKNLFSHLLEILLFIILILSTTNHQ